MTDEKKSHGSASGGTDLYFVEARTTNEKVLKIAGNVISSVWVRLYFPRGPVGVPSFTYVPIEERHHQLLSFEAALAMAHWFLAMPEDSANDFLRGHPLCVEARLVKVHMSYSFSTEECGVGPSICHHSIHKEMQFGKRGG